MKYQSRRIRIPTEYGTMKLLILQPTDGKKRSRPGVLWIHGGGYITGMPEMAYFSRAKDLVQKHGAVVVTPAYRLAGEAPYPAALVDCHTALLWMRSHARKLGIRRDQIMVGGESAGGGLAAALCMYEKDTDGVNIAFQMPLYPMLDHRDTETSRDNHAPVWNTKRNHAGWARYLRGIAGQEVPCYASPARREDYSGLPPAYTFVCTAEPFYAETRAYIQNLRRAGIEAKVDIYPGLFHAFDMLLPFRKASRRAAASFGRYFEYAKRHYFAKQEGEACHEHTEHRR